MELEVTDYLIREYFSKLTGREQLAYKHLLHDEKLAAMDDAASREKMRLMLLRVGWLSNDEKVLTLLREGIPTFRKRIARKIYSENGGEVLLNKCPKCQRLARTSRAKQCRHCGHDWH